jgi:pimeloyl-ACP methyl ester carboxylesterase
MPYATASDGTRLSYEVLGAGPPLLLVSGQASDRTVWDSVRGDFAARHQVIVFDHRGTGDSDKPEAPYSTRGFAGDAIAVLDAAGIGRAHAYGISMGGRICQWLGSITRRASVRSCSVARPRATPMACAARRRSTPSSRAAIRCA